VRIGSAARRPETAVRVDGDDSLKRVPVGHVGMPNYLATAAALFVVVLFLVALFAMTVGDYAVAGVMFLSASIVIYLREKRLVGR